MTRADEIALLQRVTNQPEVLAGVAPGYLRLDMGAFFDRPGNFLFGDDRGLVLFGDLGNGVFDVHYLFTSSLRGRAALLTIKEAFSALFTYHNARAITGAIPRENRASRAMTRALGCSPTGISVDSQGRDCINYVLERATWVTFSGA